MITVRVSKVNKSSDPCKCTHVSSASALRSLQVHTRVKGLGREAGAANCVVELLVHATECIWFFEPAITKYARG